MIENFDKMNKSEIILLYKAYLRKNELFGSKQGMKGTKPKYRRPKVNKRVISWKNFERLKKVQIIAFLHENNLLEDVWSCKGE